MYITFRRYKIDPSQSREIARQVQEGFLPIISRSVGFVSYNVFLDHEDHICSVSVYTTRAGMEEANEMAQEWATTHLAALLPAPTQVIEGETLIDKMRHEFML